MKPRYWFRVVNKRYHLDSMPTLDAGFGPGNELAALKHPESYGVDVDLQQLDLVTKIRGLNAEFFDLVNGDPDDLPQVRAVWCGAVIEHVGCPIAMLENLRSLLFPGGLLTLYSSTVPLLPSLGRLPLIGRYFRGWGNSHNLCVFTPRTLRLICERAGFETVEMLPRWPVRGLICGTVYIGRKS